MGFVNVPQNTVNWSEYVRVQLTALCGLPQLHVSCGTSIPLLKQNLHCFLQRPTNFHMRISRPGYAVRQGGQIGRWVGRSLGRQIRLDQIDRWINQIDRFAQIDQIRQIRQIDILDRLDGYVRLDIQIRLDRYIRQIRQIDRQIRLDWIRLDQIDRQIDRYVGMYVCRQVGRQKKKSLISSFYNSNFFLSFACLFRQ